MKYFASAFFGTPLAAILTAHGCDTVDRHGGVDLGLRACDRGRRAPARLPGRRAARGGWRPQPGRPRGEPLRHRHEVRATSSRSTRRSRTSTSAAGPMLARERDCRALMTDARPRPRRLPGSSFASPTTPTSPVSSPARGAGASPSPRRSSRSPRGDAARRRLGGLRPPAGLGRRAGPPANFLDVPIPVAPRVLPRLHPGRDRGGSLRGPARLDARRGHLQRALRDATEPRCSSARRTVQDEVDAFVAEQEETHAARVGGLGVADEERWANYKLLADLRPALALLLPAEWESRERGGRRDRARARRLRRQRGRASHRAGRPVARLASTRTRSSRARPGSRSSARCS